MTEPGTIINPARMKQVCSFEGMVFGSGSPTDIDGFIDFQNKLHVYIEAKYDGAELPFGQRLAYERIVDNCRIPCTVVIVKHNCPPDEAIIMADTIAVEYRWLDKWRPIRQHITCLQFIETMRERYVGEAKGGK